MGDQIDALDAVKWKNPWLWYDGLFKRQEAMGEVNGRKRDTIRKAIDMRWG